MNINAGLPRWAQIVNALPAWKVKSHLFAGHRNRGWRLRMEGRSVIVEVVDQWTGNDKPQEDVVHSWRCDPDVAGRARVMQRLDDGKHVVLIERDRKQPRSANRPPATSCEDPGELPIDFETKKDADDLADAYNDWLKTA